MSRARSYRRKLRKADPGAYATIAFEKRSAKLRAALQMFRGMTEVQAWHHAAEAARQGAFGRRFSR